MVNYANTLPLQQVETLIQNLIGVSEVLVSTDFERHVSVENLISALNDSLNQRFEVVG